MDPIDRSLYCPESGFPENVPSIDLYGEIYPLSSISSEDYYE